MILDLFAGPGGWDEGLRRILGFHNVIGVENEINARATRAAAGHATMDLEGGDVAAIDPSRLAFPVTGLIASPPCQDFTLAGKQLGLDGVRGKMVYQPIRYIEAIRPEWAAFEQVPQVLPIWKFFEELLRDQGYSTWSGILNSADYGVPQARKRAILMATRNGRVRPPTPTHGPADADDLFGAARTPHVIMADALGWARDRPNTPDWVYRRPATTVVGTFRPDKMAGPDWRKDPSVPRQNDPNAVDITLQDALVLQGFPRAYPVQGAKTRQWEQVGNAMPPPLAAAIVKELL